MSGVILKNVALLGIVLLSVVKLHCRVSFFLMWIANYAIVSNVILQNVTFLKVILPIDTLPNAVQSRCCVTYSFMRFSECHSAECRFVECHFLFFGFGDCHSAECYFTECHSAECRFLECHFHFYVLWFASFC